MGFFDFMGTFFFISLGITFVLILLLAYHFKQRLSESEQKGDKMFEIINTIVKEMGNMKRTINAIANNNTNEGEMTPANYTLPYIKKEEEYDNTGDDDEDDHDDSNDHTNAVKVYSLNMYDRENEVFIELGEHHSEHEDNDSVVEVIEPEPQVKVVNVDLTYDSHDIATDNEDSGSLSDFEADDAQEVPELHTAIGEEVIHVNKLDQVMTPTVDEMSSSSEEEKLSYHKMNLTQLRTYAVNRGLLSDSSKMKKADLIKLLESNDEN